MESYTLFQLNEYIRRVIALNFREPLWIEAEIVQCRESKGNFYLELVEKDDTSDKVIAQATAAIWYKNYQFIKRKLGEVIYDLLKDGTAVRIKCRIDFNERYGFKLFIEDIDPNYTFGKVELNRQKIISELNDQGLVDVNSSLSIPNIIQNIAVISSSNAAGYKDFIKQLEGNSYGYKYNVTLYDSAVQGQKVETDTCNAINEIIAQKEHFDAAIIIRGGGSKLDLAAYDNYNIAKAIATSGIPFIVGIGHDIDNTVADLVSAVSVKTPTAVADYLIEKSLHFESKVEHLKTVIFQRLHVLIAKNLSDLGRINEQIILMSSNMIDINKAILQSLEQRLSQSIEKKLIHEQSNLDKYRIRIDGINPERILEQGYLYASKNGEILSNKEHFKIDDEVTLHLKDGRVESKIIKL